MKREGDYFVFENGYMILADNFAKGLPTYDEEGDLISDIHRLEMCDYMIHEWLKFKFETIEKIKREREDAKD